MKRVLLIILLVAIHSTAQDVTDLQLLDTFIEGIQAESTNEKEQAKKLFDKLLETNPQLSFAVVEKLKSHQYPAETVRWLTWLLEELGQKLDEKESQLLLKNLQMVPLPVLSNDEVQLQIFLDISASRIKLGDTTIVPYLRYIVDNNNYPTLLRLNAASSLVDLGDTSCYYSLRLILNDTSVDTWDRIDAARYLARLGYSDGLELAHQIMGGTCRLETDDPYLEGLGLLGDIAMINLNALGELKELFWEELKEPWIGTLAFRVMLATLMEFKDAETTSMVQKYIEAMIEGGCEPDPNNFETAIGILEERGIPPAQLNKYRELFSQQQVIDSPPSTTQASGSTVANNNMAKRRVDKMVKRDRVNLATSAKDGAASKSSDSLTSRSIPTVVYFIIAFIAILTIFVALKFARFFLDYNRNSL